MEKKYINKEDAIKYIRMNNSQFISFSRDYLKDFRFEGKTKFYSKSELDYYINLRKQWNEEYLYYDDAVKLISTRKIFETITKQYNIKPIRKPSYAKHIDDKGFSYYHKKSLDVARKNRLESRLNESCLDSMDEYISFEYMRNQLGVTKKSLYDVKKELELNTKLLKNETFFKKLDMEKIVNLQHDFLSNHMSISCATNIIGETRLKKLERIKIPSYAKKNRDKLMVRKTDVEKVESEMFKKVEGIEKEQAIKKLNLTPKKFYETIKLFDMKSEIDTLTGRGYYKESDIEFILNQREEFGKRYLTLDTIKNEYGATVASKIRGFKAPALLHSKDLKNSLELEQHRVLVIYDRVDAEKIASEISQNKLYHNIKGETHYDTFLIKLDMINELKYLKKSVYTKKKWFDYVYGVLSVSSAGKKTMKWKINGLVNASRAIDRMLCNYNVKEIYQLTPRLINPTITASSESVSIAISQFSISVFKDVKIKLEESNIISKGYSINDLASPYERRNKEGNELGEIDTYDFAEYKLLFNFLTDIDYHINKILRGDFYKNKDEAGKRVYPSIWLYLILHLNNAWRHGDVSTFPRIEIADLLYDWNIDSIEWFKYNRLSLKQSNIITSRVIQKEFLISKTQMTGHFFCSDNLSPAFATVVVILDLYLNDMVIFSSDNIYDPLMYFDSENDEPSSYNIYKFFEGSKLDKFEFKSKKMNKTVMNFVFSIVSKGENGNRTLEIVKQLRGHSNESSTLSYIKFNMEEIEFLTELLFRRGEFGYITEKLLDISGMSSQSIDKKSFAIEAINNNFGSYEKVEAVVGLASNFNRDKNKIVNMINNLTLDEVIDTLIDIYCGKLPSKEKDIQCLVSKTGCVNPKKECKLCAYHIPSLYALNSILNSLRQDVGKYFAEKNIGTKMKLTASINNKVKVMGEAVSRYGEEVVYNYLQISRNDFLEIYDNIPDTEDLYNYILENIN
ncbi:hypothetical protein [Paraclostridium bifermentans]|uniref:hypothetical protein n=1 Tax=Paraclostridium bifermentans TaxID=1490 RepID=UPI001FF2732F|nr:hypothetical protein [Paraclostridium bifermentans]UOW66787.1 hypothetical protein MTR78_09510 [Paraclostridium bifermentans]